MRRDVRLLGDLLGEVLRESGGQDLLDDVERLRRAVIARPAAAARALPSVGPDADPAGDEIAALVASWPLDRAELVARAFTVYFHLANLAEEQQRVRALRERDTGDAPVRESLAAAVGRAPPRQGPAQLAEPARPGCGCTRCSPRTPPRRAAARWPPRCAGSASCWPGWTTPRAGAAEQAEARRRLREEIDLLWRTSPLRAKAMTPLDEVRTVMAAFDETLFRVVPRGVPGAGPGAAGPAAGPGRPGARRSCGSAAGSARDRDGNPFVTAAGDQGDRGHPGRPRAARAGERGHPDRPRAHRARATRAPPSARRSPCALERPRRRTRSCSPRSAARSPRRAVPDATCSTWPSGSRDPAARTPTWPTAVPPSSSPTCAWCRSRWPRRARPGRRSASCST